MPRPKLTRADLIKGLNRLGELAAEEKVVLELCVFGGSALMLAYDCREFTKDLDVLVRPPETGARLLAQAGIELGFGADWFDQEVRRFAAEEGSFAPLQIEELEVGARMHLRLTRPSAGYLLALKCMACRPPLPGYPGDEADITFLIRKIGIKNLQQLEALIDKYYSFDGLQPRAREVIAAILEEQRDT
jgi:hypothetical protein